MTQHGVLAIGLDGFEISFAEELTASGDLPVLADRRARGAFLLLDHTAAAERTGLSWEHFWSGLTPDVADRFSPVEFNPADYTAWQEGARFAPFFSSLGTRTAVFDTCYADLDRAPGVEGVVAWGAHDPGLSGAASNPARLLQELLTHAGPYPSEQWTYGNPWPSVEETRAMGEGLVAGVTARSQAASWLLGERLTDWDLGVAVVAEPHSAAEALWHGVDPNHPLHTHASAPAARDGLIATYRAVDRFVGELIEATDPRAVVVFSMGGMGPNRSDAPSMVLLPELVFRWALGERLLEVPAAWAAAPGQPPDPGGRRMTWNRAWYPSLGTDAPGHSLRRWSDHLPDPIRRRVRSTRQARRARTRPAGYRAIGWQPALWYQPRWAEMRAFALPSLYDGRIRVNLRGREAMGMVGLADYEHVCDEIEALVRDCVDPRTGEAVVEDVERPGAGRDPLALGAATADLVVVWQGCALALDHPVHGLVGPVPFRRTGGHTGPYGFASVSGPGIVPGDHGIASSFDVAPTIVDLLGAPPVEGISGQSVLGLLQGAPSRV